MNSSYLLSTLHTRVVYKESATANENRFDISTRHDSAYAISGTLTSDEHRHIMLFTIQFLAAFVNGSKRSTTLIVHHVPKPNT